MAKVKKKAVPVGSHRGQGKPVEVTPERVDHWVRVYDEIKGTGRKFPVPWGHLPGAVEPLNVLDNPAHREFFESRYNAGYIDGMARAEDGGLELELDLPGLDVLPDGSLIEPKSGTVVKDISVGQRDEFRDGQGRAWQDVIVHAALTPNPAWADPKGFAGLSAPEGVQLQTLSLATLSRPLTEEKAKAAPVTPGTGPAPAGQPEELLTPPKPDEAATLGQQVLAKLSSMGVTMPDRLANADPKTIFEHILTALTVLEGRLMQQQSQATQTAAAAQTPAVPQEPQQAYLSLNEYNDSPVIKRLVDERDAERRRALAAKLDRLLALGCPPPVIERLKAAAAMSRLSMSTLDFESPAPHQLAPAAADLLEEVLAALPESARSYLSSATEVKNPLEEEKDGKAPTDQEMDELLDAAYPQRRAALDAAGGGSNGNGRKG